MKGFMKGLLIAIILGSITFPSPAVTQSRRAKPDSAKGKDCNCAEKKPAVPKKKITTVPEKRTVETVPTQPKPKSLPPLATPTETLKWRLEEETKTDAAKTAPPPQPSPPKPDTIFLPGSREIVLVPADEENRITVEGRHYFVALPALDFFELRGYVEHRLRATTVAFGRFRLDKSWGAALAGLAFRPIPEFMIGISAGFEQINSVAAEGTQGWRGGGFVTVEHAIVSFFATVEWSEAQRLYHEVALPIHLTTEVAMGPMVVTIPHGNGTAAGIVGSLSFPETPLTAYGSLLYNGREGLEPNQRAAAIAGVKLVW